MSRFRKILKWFGVFLFLLAAVAVVFVFAYGRPPALRPDLATSLPEGVPAPPPGYPSEISSFLAGWFLHEILPWEDAPPVPGVVQKLDIGYGKGGDVPLHLDLYSPENLQTPAPGLVLYYGGGFQEGRKDQLRVYAQHFARNGYVVAAPQYRLKEAGLWPNSIHDAKCAVRWMRAHAAENKVDPDRIGVMGNSAGAYLALMVGYTAGMEEFEGDGGWEDYSSAAQAVTDIYGPSDMTKPNFRNRGLLTAYMNGSPEEDLARFEKASPIQYVGPATPPTCIVHGTVDTLVPIFQSDWLAEKLKEQGVPYVYTRIDGWPHGMDFVSDVNRHTRALILRFFDQHLKKIGKGSEGQT